MKPQLTELENAMQACASSTDNFVAAQSADEIKKAFEEIGGALKGQAELALSK